MASYQLLKSDGTFLLELTEGVTDTTSTSLTLLGKNVVSFGTALNSNFIHLVENFASAVEPTAPLIGQLWFNAGTNRLCVYDANETFVNLQTNSASHSAPSDPVTGDLWYDTVDDVLKVYTTGSTFKEVSPIERTVLISSAPFTDAVTLSKEHANNVIVLESGEGQVCTFYLPPVNSVFPIGATIKIVKLDFIEVIIYAQNGLTVYTKNGIISETASMTAGKVKEVELTCIARNKWMIVGDIDTTS